MRVLDTVICESWIQWVASLGYNDLRVLDTMICEPWIQWFASLGYNDLRVSQNWYTHQEYERKIKMLKHWAYQMKWQSGKEQSFLFVLYVMTELKCHNSETPGYYFKICIQKCCAPNWQNQIMTSKYSNHSLRTFRIFIILIKFFSSPLTSVRNLNLFYKSGPVVNLSYFYCLFLQPGFVTSPLYFQYLTALQSWKVFPEEMINDIVHL